MNHLSRYFVMCTALSAIGGCTSIQTQPNETWLLSAQTDEYGTLESLVEFSTDRRGQMQGASEFFTVVLPQGGDATAQVTVNFIDGGSTQVDGVQSDDGALIFDVTHERWGGEWSLSQTNISDWRRDYNIVQEAVQTTMQQWLYDPRLLNETQYLEFKTDFARRSVEANDDFEFMDSFDDTWDGELFSHFEVLRPLNTMEGLLEEADEASEEKPVAHFELLEPEIALVTFDSFFGTAIEQQIDDAMIAAIDSGATSLIIDVRENPGGTTAAVPVGSRIIQEQAVFGYFLANKWWRDHTTLPSLSELEARPTLNGRTPPQLMGELMQTGVVAASVYPAEKTFDGDVYILISERSGSATEAVVGMLKMSGRVTLVGETTAGRMLSSNFFPLPDDFSVRIPVADFFLMDGSRIDGAGVSPDVEVADEDALAKALELIRSK